MSQEQLNTEAGNGESPAEGKKLRILVVDDSATIRRSAETMLTSEGCEVITAENGFEALSKITRYQPQFDICRYHDAAPRWLSNLCHHQEQCRIP